ncbi:MAG: hypothetical protein JNJ77_01605 [Planctomycetia bacterium]|nr:hypothetical protein [Planctomycetia bacterium]
MKLFTIIVALLSTLPAWAEDKPESTFKLLGGWRIAGEFARGGIAIDHANRKLYMVGHAQRNEVYEYELPEHGIGNDPASWPRVNIVRTIKGWWEGGYANSLAFYEGKLWAAPRMFYDMKPPRNLVLYAMSGETKNVFLPRQQYGGFVKSAGKFPEVGGGGYESGQGTSFGPTLGTLDGRKLIHHDFSGKWDTREKREPNYYPVTNKDGWTALMPRELNGKKEGRWACDRIYAGGIRLPSGIYYWPSMGIGDIDYNRQNETFAAKNLTYQYRYNPENYQLIGWKLLPDMGIVIGQELSPDGKLLYLCIRSIWKSGMYKVDNAVMVFEVK